MERLVLIILGIIVVAGGIVWSMGNTPPPTPSQAIALEVETIESACTQACAGTAAQFTLDLPAGSALYTTAEAACVTYGKALFCSRCGCAMTADVRLSAGSHNCTMLPGESLTLDCTTFINS